MRITIDEETSIELMQGKVLVTGVECDGDGRRGVVIPLNDKAREAVDTLHKLTRAAVSEDKLDGKQMPRRGEIWRHYKGTYYEVVGTAAHTEDNDVLVLYKEMQGSDRVWARPLLMWHDDVGDGKQRFTFAEEDEG